MTFDDFVGICMFLWVGIIVASFTICTSWKVDIASGDICETYAIANEGVSLFKSVCLEYSSRTKKAHGACPNPLPPWNKCFKTNKSCLISSTNICQGDVYILARFVLYVLVRFLNNINKPASYYSNIILNSSSHKQFSSFWMTFFPRQVKSIPWFEKVRKRRLRMATEAVTSRRAMELNEGNMRTCWILPFLKLMAFLMTRIYLRKRKRSGPQKERKNWTEQALCTCVLKKYAIRNLLRIRDFGRSRGFIHGSESHCSIE